MFSLESSSITYYFGIGQTTIGRPDSAVPYSKSVLYLSIKSISKPHCRLEVGPRPANKLNITDLGSSHGTWVNQEKVQVKELKNGDSLKIGAISFKVKEIDYGVAITSIKQEQKEVLRSTLRDLDISEVAIKDAKYLVTTQITITAKILLAMILQIEIVTPLFFTSLANSHVEPEAKAYLPKVIDMNLEPVCFGPNPGRRTILNKINFLIEDADIRVAYSEIIMLAGGQVYSEMQSIMSKTNELAVCVGKTDEGFLLKTGLTQIEASDIPQAIMYCSREFCKARLVAKDVTPIPEIGVPIFNRAVEQPIQYEPDVRIVSPVVATRIVPKPTSTIDPFDVGLFDRSSASIATSSNSIADDPFKSILRRPSPAKRKALDTQDTMSVGKETQPESVTQSSIFDAFFDEILGPAPVPSLNTKISSIRAQTQRSKVDQAMDIDAPSDIAVSNELIRTETRLAEQVRKDMEIDYNGSIEVEVKELCKPSIIKTNYKRFKNKGKTRNDRRIIAVVYL